MQALFYAAWLLALTVGGAALALPVVQGPVALTFSNGHRLDWQGCDLAGWYGPGGVKLAQGLTLSFPSSLTRQSASQNGDTATVVCTGNGGTVTFTLTGTARDWGATYAGVTWQLTLDATAPLGQLTAGLGFLAYNGDPYGLTQFAMDATWEGMYQFNFEHPEQIHGVCDPQQTFTLLTRAEGAYVAYVSDFHDTGDLTGFCTHPYPPVGVGLDKTFTPPGPGLMHWRMPPMTLLWTGTPRGTAQHWLDARFGSFNEQWASLGLTARDFHPMHEGSGGGAWDWSGVYTADWPYGYIWYYLRGQDQKRAFYHTGIFSGADVNHITGDDPLAPDMYFPNASDLPASIPGVTFAGQPPLQDPKDPGDLRYGYMTQGTMQQLRDLLDSQRILGMFPGMWSRDYYSACPDDIPADTSQYGQWSRWDKTWPCSYIWKAHPDWGARFSDGNLKPRSQQAFPNYSDPAADQWRHNWHRYWLDLGLMSFFRDTGCFPCAGWDYNASGQASDNTLRDWNLLKDVARNGGTYIVGEQPLLFGVSTPDHTGNIEFHKYQEWVYTFANKSWGTINRGYLHYDRTLMDWDPVSARRTHNIVGVSGCCDNQEVMTTNAASIAASFQGYTDHIQRYGPPTRVELVNSRPVAWPTWLHDPMDASQTTIAIHNTYALPQSTVVQVEGEQIFIPNRFGPPWCGGDANIPFYYGCNVGSGITRGYNGTTPAAHAVGATIQPLDDRTHYDWDDAYWVYGTGANEVWLRYSDGALFNRGGTQARGAPQISNVQVNGNTVIWTTDTPTQGWVEYDTYGAMEAHNDRRLDGLWPAYRWGSDNTDAGLPPASTSHSTVLDRLEPGKLYHYSVVARAPVGARSADATFTANLVQATPTPVPTPTSVPPTPPPGSVPVVTVSPAVAESGGAVTVSWTGNADAGANFHLSSADQAVWYTDPAFYGDCTPTPTNSVIASGACTVTLPALADGGYRFNLLDAADTVVLASGAFYVGVPPTATPTATATATATPTPTRTPTNTPTATPIPCQVPVSRNGGPQALAPIDCALVGG